MQDTPQMIKSSAEAVIGTGLFLTPWWSQFLLDVSLLASMVAQVTGALIGVYGVIKIAQGLTRAGQRSKKREQKHEHGG